MNAIMKHSLIYLFLIMFTALINGLSAQQSNIIELRHADQLQGMIRNGEEVRELIGNVHFVQFPANGGLVKVWCDRALRYIVQNKIELYGNVKVIRDSVTIRSNEGIYYGDLRMMEGQKGVELERGRTLLTAINAKYFIEEKRTLFWDHVVLADTSSVITCNTMNYFETDARSIAAGNVHLFEKTNAVNIYGDSLVHLEQQKFTQVMQQPRLVRIDTSSAGIIDTMVVESKIMQSFQDSTDRFIAIDDVRMVRSDLSSRCGTATYYMHMDKIILQTHPIIWSGGNQITGDSIRVIMENKKLRSLWVKNRAMAVSRVDTTLTDRFNQLTGRELTMYFRADKLEQVYVQKNATSLYYLFDNNEPNGVNKSSGDRIIIDFITGKVDRIKVIGGVQGQYFPEKMILNHEMDYNLDGFRIFENRPIRQGIKIFSE
jgi:lipopolysaccharide export system protein LptA